MKYLIIYTYTYRFTGLMGLEDDPEVLIDGYKFCDNIHDLQDFIKELELDKDVLCVDEIIEINNYENIINNFINENSKLWLK